mmetsp:Transcript_14285/g.30168  ORF Transcript_14285/g.30168 Transcript_14285/m.30168 type:complete len:242 (+) Transcript_14285:314-1039(+)
MYSSLSSGTSAGGCESVGGGAAATSAEKSMRRRPETICAQRRCTKPASWMSMMNASARDRSQMTTRLPSGANSERSLSAKLSRAASGTNSSTSQTKTRSARAPSGSAGTPLKSILIVITFVICSLFERVLMARMASERTSKAKTVPPGSAAANAKLKMPVPAPTSTMIAFSDRWPRKCSTTFCGCRLATLRSLSSCASRPSPVKESASALCPVVCNCFSCSRLLSSWMTWYSFALAPRSSK